ncbi:S-layer homology domain-containing protein [Paenibacillus sp. HB172176]|uniref:S-layer homology domain-containing protein n=1 Tax=Paenibacillus sp. HB172176 TaxID=2493690 RepID=UPI00143952B0|nr:S-layer homology domain-containing protein [Paenibacillus sp. HB172176]
MKRFAAPILCFVLCFTLFFMPKTFERAFASAVAGSATAFADIHGHWAEPNINDMLKKGILDGFPDGTFRPDDPVQIDQFVKMLILSFSDLYENGSRSWNNAFLSTLSQENLAVLKQDYRYFSFKPNTTGYWAKDFIDIASDLHFLNKAGYTDFQARLTRENAAEIIYYTLQETEFLEDSAFGLRMASEYGDIMGATEREQRFIAESLVKGIMNGYTNGFFGVGDYVTRAQALVILERLRDKSKRLAIEVSPENLERIVPTSGNGSKIVVFPNKKMWDAYDLLASIGSLRGANHDLLGTTLRLFKDQDEMSSVINKLASATEVNEEAAIWLDPTYNTYGVTMRLREGSLARNREVVEQFANGLFGYNAIAFKNMFNDVCSKIENGKTVDTLSLEIGSDAVSILVDYANKTVIFSIVAKQS